MGPTPPPYEPMGKKKTSTTTIVLIVLGICAVCCVLGVLGTAGAGFFAFKKAKNFASCSVGATEVGHAVVQYADDHNGKLPDAKTWQDEVKPYFAKLAAKGSQKVSFLNSMDPNGVWGCKDETGTGMTGFAFDSDLSGKKLDDIQDKQDTVMIFETSKTGINLAEPYKELPRQDSPKIMNSPRGWILINANGRVIPAGT